MNIIYRILQIILLIQLTIIYGYGQVQDTRRSYVCYMKAEDISMDGLLNEASWEVGNKCHGYRMGSYADQTIQKWRKGDQWMEHQWTAKSDSFGITNGLF